MLDECDTVNSGGVTGTIIEELLGQETLKFIMDDVEGHDLEFIRTLGIYSSCEEGSTRNRMDTNDGRFNTSSSRRDD